MQPEGNLPARAADAQRDIWTVLPRPDALPQQQSSLQPTQLHDAGRLPSLSGIPYPREQRSQPRQSEANQYTMQAALRIGDSPRFSSIEPYPRPRPIFVQQGGGISGMSSPMASPEYPNFPRGSNLQPSTLQSQTNVQSAYGQYGREPSESPGLRPWDLHQRRPLSEPSFRPLDTTPRIGPDMSTLPSPLPYMRSNNRQGESMSRNSSLQGFSDTPAFSGTPLPPPPPSTSLPYSRKRRSDSSEDEGEDGSSLVKWKQVHLDLLVRMKNEGSKWSDIASALNNGKSANACRKMYAKVIKDRDVWTPELDQALKQLYRQKREAFWTDIAQELNTNWHDVEARVIALGLGAVRHQ